MISPCEDAGTGGRTQSGGVHVGVAQAILGQVIDVRRGDRATIATKLTKTCVIEHDEKHVGRTLFGASGSGQAGCDWSNVRPMTPLKAVPGLYSFRDMNLLL